MIEALRKRHHHYRESLQVEAPRGSGTRLTRDQAADELRRLLRIFQRSSPASHGEAGVGVGADGSRRPACSRAALDRCPLGHEQGEA